MGCKCKVFVCPVDQDEMKECGEPELIPGVCYDHTYLCPVCHQEPTYPAEIPCSKCAGVI